jgi:uncharacterized YigZ family protein
MKNRNLELNMLECYKTLTQKASIEIVVKKSRFIATATHIESREEAEVFIHKTAKKYRNASHNVFAFRVGVNNEIERFSDDGEPSGTAGKPVLEVLKGNNLRFSAIVVTRYFGGTLLGTGGLQRAYGKSARESVLSSGIIERILYEKFLITVEYSLMGKLQYLLPQKGYIINGSEFSDQVKLEILVESKMSGVFIKDISDITNASALIVKDGFIYGSLIKEKIQLFPLMGP